MFRPLISVSVFLAAASSVAQAQPSQEQLVQNKQKKLAEAFLTKAAWITDYDQARAEARKSGKLIFTYFTRSYAA
jgi:hypothetical protein